MSDVLKRAKLEGCGQSKLSFATQRKIDSSFFENENGYRVTVLMTLDDRCGDKKWSTHAESANYTDGGGGMWENKETQCLASGVDERGTVSVICEVPTPIDSVQIWRPEE